jgi:uncharacterized protein
VLDVREHGEAVVVSLRVRPRSRPGVGLTDGGLVIRVAAAPEKGRATEEGRRSLAQALGVPTSAVTLRSGAASRSKTFTVSGITAVEARRRLLEAARSG